MRKLTVIVVICICLMVALLVVAFFYIDLSTRRRSTYEISLDGRLWGQIEVDRYITEDKIVYKGSMEYPYSRGYSRIDEKIFLKRGDKLLLKFSEESYGMRGQNSLFVLVQEGETSDVLFLEHPRYIAIQDFDTGRKTMPFYPSDIMSYMPLVERYNFWEKGAQFFEIMIPTGEPLPPMRDKLEIMYLKEEYVTVMGRRIEAESFIVRAASIPEARLVLGKYSHQVLSLEIKDLKMRFVLAGSTDTPGDRMLILSGKMVKFFRTGKWATGVHIYKKTENETLKGDDSGVTDIDKAGASTGRDMGLTHKTAGKEVFFESNKLILSGRVWAPRGEGPRPAAIIIPKDGPVTNGEEEMIAALARELSDRGVMVMVFDYPGQGKSQGIFSAATDQDRILNIEDAVRHLESNPLVSKGDISLIGHEGGGYMAIMAANRIATVRSCVLLGIPESFKVDTGSVSTKDHMKRIVASKGLGPFDEGFMNLASIRVQAHIKSVELSREKVTGFMGVKMPVGAYREFMARAPYRAVISFDRPILWIMGKNDRRYEQGVITALENERKKRGQERDKIAVFRDLGEYLGQINAKGQAWQFVINKDVSGLVCGWISGDDKE